MTKISKVQARRILCFIENLAQGELNGIALSLGLATPQTDAMTVIHRLRNLADGVLTERADVRAILADPTARERLMVGVIVATQAREGIMTTPEQALRAYRAVNKA